MTILTAVRRLFLVLGILCEQKTAELASQALELQLSHHPAYTVPFSLLIKVFLMERSPLHKYLHLHPSYKRLVGHVPCL